MAAYNSYYLYEKYEKRGNQPWIPVYPNTWSINGDGTMPVVLKQHGDRECADPIYRWVQTDDTICVEAGYKYKLTLNDSSVVSAECDSTSILKESDVSAYSQTCVSVDIGNCVESIGNTAFYGCINLTSATISDSVTELGDSVFTNCSGLTNVTLPSRLTSIPSGTFNWCSSLTSVVIPSGVTNIDGLAFYLCTSLTSIIIPDRVANIDFGAFWQCTSLTTIDIPDRVNTIGAMSFSECSGLTEVSIGSGCTSIGSGAFANCTNLGSLTVKAIDPPTLENNALNNTSPSLVIYVPSDRVATYKSASGWNQYALNIRPI
jgi:hypothetical protein